MRVIRLGIIGASKGNGHPYSWSAIINGYDKKKMNSCGFPFISNYLDKKSWPRDYIKNSKVTHIWTQNLKTSNKIASTTFIPNVVINRESMIGQVDGILLARDDYKNHYNLAKPFLLSGIPVYIDKPISISKRKLKKIYDLEVYSGQIFTCSATRYSSDLSLNRKKRKQLGKIKKIIAVTPKSWDKYSIHIIEPVLKMLPKNDSILKFTRTQNIKKKNLLILWKSGIITHFIASGNLSSKISILIIGSKRQIRLVFNDTFDSFKRALMNFLYGIKKKTIQSDKKMNLKVVDIIEKGIRTNE
jgi:hypothetical protein